MITNKQLYRLKDLHTHTWDKETADALAAAIATLEGLPVDRNKVRVASGDELEYHGDGYTLRGVCNGSHSVYMHRVRDDGGLEDGAALAAVAHCTAAAARGGEDA